MAINGFTTNAIKPRRVHPATRRRNRARLAAIQERAIAENKPAIVAPPGCFDLADAGIKPPKAPKEIRPMKRKTKKKTVSDDTIREIHAAYEAGESVQDLAERHGLHITTLYRRFKLLDLKIDSSRKPKKAKRAAAKPQVRKPTAPTAVSPPIKSNGAHAPESALVAAEPDIPAEVAAAPLPQNLGSFLDTMIRLGGQVQISGEVDVNIKVKF